MVVVTTVAGIRLVVVDGLYDCVTGLRGVGVVGLLVAGQHTPGTNKLLKHKDCRRFPKLSKSCGQSLRSLQ